MKEAAVEKCVVSTFIWMRSYHHCSRRSYQPLLLVSVTAHHCVIDEHWLLDILHSIFYLSAKGIVKYVVNLYACSGFRFTVCILSDSCRRAANPERDTDCEKPCFPTRSVSQERRALSSLPGQEWTVSIDTYSTYIYTHKCSNGKNSCESPCSFSVCLSP